MTKIRDAEAEKYSFRFTGNKNKSKMDWDSEDAFKAGFDCRDKLDHEALKVAVEALKKIKDLGSYAGTPTKEISEYLVKQAGMKCQEISSEALTKIRNMINTNL
jgi:hypothetical protein